MKVLALALFLISSTSYAGSWVCVETKPAGAPWQPLRAFAAWQVVTLPASQNPYHALVRPLDDSPYVRAFNKANGCMRFANNLSKYSVIIEPGKPATAGMFVRAVVYNNRSSSKIALSEYGIIFGLDNLGVPNSYLFRKLEDTAGRQVFKQGVPENYKIVLPVKGGPSKALGQALDLLQ